MHPHRIGDSCSCAATVGRPPCPRGEEQNRACDEPRVVGVGAPLSVLIRPSVCETPHLREQVRAALAEHERERPDAGTPAADWWAEEQDVWKSMLAALDDEAAHPIELMWPTAYAHSVLLGALRDAVARLAPPSTPDDARRLRDTLGTACACFATWEAFIAIDNGGLQDVAL